jgi:hypothetical protein
MRRAAKLDGNHAEVVKALRAAKCGVLDLARVGHGCPDLLVHAPTWPHTAVLLEIKDSAKPPSARKLTEAQERFHGEWRGPLAVVTTPEEALCAVRIAADRGKVSTWKVMP